MSLSVADLTNEAKQCGAVCASLFDTSALTYPYEFRRPCEQSKCGHYGRNWMCPPAVGSFDHLKAKAGRYRYGLVFQTGHGLSHSLDRKGIQKAFVVHDSVLEKVKGLTIDNTYAMENVLSLGAGSCTHCSTCSSVNGLPCPFPDKAVASLESHGIDVAELVKRCGIPYHNDKNTVSYVGCILFTTSEDISGLKKE